MKEKLRKIVEENTNKRGRIFDYFIQFLILLSIISMSIETLPDNSAFTIDLIQHINIFCVFVFTLEYLLRIYVAKKPFSYIFSFYGIIDLFAILPFYLRLGIDLRHMRVFRIFRIFNALKLVRYSRAFHRFHLAFHIIKEEIVIFLIATCIFLFFTAAGIYYFENPAQPEQFSSIFHSLWWSIITITTVGYGDIYPITIGGRLFTFFILIIGIGIITVPTGIVASALSQARELEAQERKKK